MFVVQISFRVYRRDELQSQLGLPCFCCEGIEDASEKPFLFIYNL